MLEGPHSLIALIGLAQSSPLFSPPAHVDDLAEPQAAEGRRLALALPPLERDGVAVAQKESPPSSLPPSPLTLMIWPSRRRPKEAEWPWLFPPLSVMAYRWHRGSPVGR